MQLSIDGDKMATFKTFKYNGTNVAVNIDNISYIKPKELKSEPLMQNLAQPLPNPDAKTVIVFDKGNTLNIDDVYADVVRVLPTK